MLEWTRRAIALRKEHAVLRRRHYFRGRPLHGEESKDLSWLRPDGQEMSEAEWRSSETGALALWLSGRAADIQDELGRPVADDTLLIMLNQDDHAVEFRLPEIDRECWTFVLDTDQPEKPPGEACESPTYRLAPRALAILRHDTGEAEG